MHNSLDISDFDRLLVEGLSREVDIGVFAEERGKPQQLSFDMVVALSAIPESEADQIDDILSYDELIFAIDDALKEKRYNLLEHLGEVICQKILAHPQAQTVTLSIYKPERIDGRLGISMRRTGDQVIAQTAATLGDLVICACADQEAAARALKDHRAPLIVIRTKADETDEQAAYLSALYQHSVIACDFASKHPQIQMSRSIAEVRYGLAHEAPQVWVPDALVMAAAEPPKHLSELAVWLQGQLKAGAVQAYE